MSLTLKASDHAWKEHIRTREDALGKELKLERSLLKYFHENRRLLPKTMPKVKNPGIFYSHAMVCHRFGMHMKLAFAVFDRISEVSNLPSREIQRMRDALETLFAAPTSLLLNMDNFKANSMKWMENELLMEFFSTSNDQWKKMVDFLDQDRVKKKLLRALNQPALRGGSKKTSSIFDELVEEMVELKGGEDKCNGKKSEDCKKDEDCEYVPGAKSENGRPYCHSKQKQEYEPKEITEARAPTNRIYLVLLAALLVGLPYRSAGWFTDWSYNVPNMVTNIKDFNNIRFFPGDIEAMVTNVQTVASLTAAVSGMMSLGMTLYMFGFVNIYAMGGAALTRGVVSYYSNKNIQRFQVATETMEVYFTFYLGLISIINAVIQYIVMGEQKVRRTKNMIGPMQVTRDHFAAYIGKILALSTKTLKIAGEISGNMDATIAMALLMFSGMGGWYIYGTQIKKYFQENFGRSMTDEEFNKLGSEVEKRSRRRQLGSTKKNKNTNANSNALRLEDNNNNVSKKKKTRPKCKCVTIAGNQCKRDAAQGSEYCKQHKNCFMDIRNMPDDESKTGN
jgi:hypothetical protein